MQYSLKIGTWFKIPVFIHWSFGLILLWIGYEAFSNDMGWTGFFIFLAAMMSVFICVLLHEFGHALAARRYKVHTRDIILTPIGGIARLESMPNKPKEELVVAIAGPLVNVAIVIILLVLSFFIFGWAEIQTMLSYVGAAFSELLHRTPIATESDGQEPSIALEVVTMLITANSFLFAFNLIPAFPMDGGRILRALLEMGSNKLKATRIAAFIGQIIALGFMYVGVQNEPHTLAIIGVFIFFAARTEYKSLQFQEKINEVLVEKFMATDMIKVYVETTVKELRSSINFDSPRLILILNKTNSPIGFTSPKIITEKLELPSYANEDSDMFPFIHGIAGYFRPDETLKDISDAFPPAAVDRLFLVRELDAFEVLGYVTTKHFEYMEQNGHRWLIDQQKREREA